MFTDISKGLMLSGRLHLQGVGLADPAEMFRQPEGKRQQRQGRVGLAGRRKDRRAGDEQIADAMQAAVRVDDAALRIGRHAGRTDMVAADDAVPLRLGDQPVAVNTTISSLNGKTVVAVAAGAEHSLALCSDGVWEYVTEPELWETTQVHGPAAAARALADQAARRGGKIADNATLILLRAGAGTTVASEHWLRRVSASFASLFHGDRR